MPNFTPNSKIHIGRVPWDNSYRHTRTFASASAQATWMLNRCTQALSRTDYTYVRMNNSIRVPFNAESLYTYNYVMYQNANYGSKWFYAFIVAVNYVNENMTELVLELDLMQTWYFDYNLKQCFVEREHVNDDTVGLHINPEPNIPFETFMTNFVPEVVKPTVGYIVVLLNVKLLDMALSYYATADSGGYYQGQYNACKAVLFNMAEPNAYSCFRTFIEAVNEAGAAESICDIYTVPSWAVDTTHLSRYGTIFENTDPVYTYSDSSVPMKTKVAPNGIDVPTTNGTYTPKNKKLLTYPYTYLEVGDFSGRTTDYRYEFFTKDSLGKVNFMKSCASISDGDVYITPFGYNGAPCDFLEGYWQTNSTQQPFTFSISNKISWVYAAYQNWLGQNGVSMALSLLGSLAMVGGGALLAGGAGGLAAGAARGVGASARGLSDEAIFGAAAAGGIQQAGSVASTLYRQSRNPNKAMGTTGTNSKLQNDYCGWYYAKITVRPEFAEIIDDFFDMYGYQVDLVKVPNREGRTSWNYVKTNNSCHYGNVPADDMAKINSIYDAGITFWHTDDIGNYSLDNSIVTP